MSHHNADLDKVREYHLASKHHLRRAARSLGYMDWANQPDPFRRFAGAPEIPLDLPEDDGGPPWDALFEGLPDPVAADSGSIARLFHDSLALSAWKQVLSPEGQVVSRWALRVNPSSGNLHPTEGYLVSGPVPGLTEEPGIFHFAARDFLLERRGSMAPEAWAKLSAGWPPGTFLVGLTSIHWREAWKYGERAFRYCQHDVGHAVAAVTLAAACLGWRTTLVDRASTGQVGLLLGAHLQDGPEAEHPDCLLAVFPDGGDHPEPIPGAMPHIAWHGEPNQLSREHHRWPVIAEVAAAARWQGTVFGAPQALPEAFAGLRPEAGARHLIRRRRSAVAMDGATGISLDAFSMLMGRLLPGALPFRSLPWPPQVSLAVFAHRVSGLEPGLYALSRAPQHEADLRRALRQDFAWERPGGIPENLPLYRLAAGDLRAAARLLSCRQDIAADGAFSLGMLARFDAPLAEYGPGIYPRLFWETGAIGQMLYLEAEAAGLQGTGIGCFFDDEVHGGLGLTDSSWQSLYHFTVGKSVQDGRLQTGEPYPKNPGTPLRC